MKLSSRRPHAMLRVSLSTCQCLNNRVSPYVSQRWASTTSAIKRGLRATRDERGSRPTPKRTGTTTSQLPDRRSRRSTGFTLGRRPERVPRRSGTRDDHEPRRIGRDSPRPNDALSHLKPTVHSRAAPASRRLPENPNRRAGVTKDNPGQDSAEKYGRYSKPQPRWSGAPFSSRDAPQQRSRQQEAPSCTASRMRERPGRTAYAQSAPRQDSRQGGLLREVKSACKLVQTIQQRETSGEGVDDALAKLRSHLDGINSFVKSGSFREHPSEAVAAIIEKHAAEGTFSKQYKSASNRSIITQRPDGRLIVSIGQGGSVESTTPKDSPSAARRVPQEDDTQKPDKRSGAEGSDYDRRATPRNKEEDEDDDAIPLPLPYTSAASEFLYGYNTVLAALRAKRRKMYKLYIHPKIFDRELDADIARGNGRRHNERAANEFVTLAKAAGVGFKNEFKTSLLDRMSDGRAHNGLVLEASRIPAPPVLSLGTPDRRTSTIPLSLAQQSKEDAEVNGTPRHVESIGQTWRYPLVVMLDGIIDPGNLGNIIRTCYFYGVDAVAVATNTCANLSSGVLAKASSGACEAVRLLSLPQPSNFAYESARNGWKIYASVAPPTGHANGVEKSRHLITDAIAANSPLAKHPCILMLGAEGQGLRENLINRANATVSIQGGMHAKDTPNIGVDSINVSVAAGVLIDAFSRKPRDAPEKKDTSAELGW